MEKEKTASGPLLVLAAFCVVLYLTGLLNSSSGFYDSDSYYHLAFSGFIKDFGLRHTFPWAQFSVLKDTFADKDIFFHILILPFLYLIKNPVAAGKCALTFFDIAFILAYLYVLRAYVPAALAALILVLPFFSSVFTFYCLQLRSITLASTFGILIVYFLIRKKPRTVFLLTLLYTLSHLSFYMLIPIAIACEILRSLREKEFCAGTIGAVLSAIAVGILLHPNFPNNVLIIYLNGMVAPWLALNSRSLGPCGEMLPENTRQALINNPTLFLSLGLIIWVFLFKRRKADFSICVWFFCASMYLTLAFIANRFWYDANVYYFIFLAACIGRLWRDHAPQRHARRIKVLVIAYVAAAMTCACLNNNAVTALMNFYGPRSVYYENIALWMQKNIPPGHTVYHSYWDDAPYFICFNPKDNYINVIDPIYMYWRHKPEFALMDQLSLGMAGNPKEVINKVFKAEYGFLRKEEPLGRQVKNDALNFEILYSNPAGMIFKTR